MPHNSSSNLDEGGFGQGMLLAYSTRLHAAPLTDAGLLLWPSGSHDPSPRSAASPSPIISPFLLLTPRCDGGIYSTSCWAWPLWPSASPSPVTTQALPGATLAPTCPARRSAGLEAPPQRSCKRCPVASARPRFSPAPLEAPYPARQPEKGRMRKSPS